MAAESGADVHHDAPRWLLALFDATAGELAEWSAFDAEVERPSVEVRGFSREDLRALVEGSIFEIPTTEHRRLRQEASDFVRWGRRGGRRTLTLYFFRHQAWIRPCLKVGSQDLNNRPVMFFGFFGNTFESIDTAYTNLGLLVSELVDGTS